jgi:hypothetical protein
LIHDIFLVWGGDAPNPFRGIPFYSMSLHSAGLPGRVKRNPDNALLSGLRFTECNWKPSAYLDDGMETFANR